MNYISLFWWTQCSWCSLCRFWVWHPATIETVIWCKQQEAGCDLIWFQINIIGLIFSSQHTISFQLMVQICGCRYSGASQNMYDFNWIFVMKQPVMCESSALCEYMYIFHELRHLVSGSYGLAVRRNVILCCCRKMFIGGLSWQTTAGKISTCSIFLINSRIGKHVVQMMKATVPVSYAWSESTSYTLAICKFPHSLIV